MEKTPFDEKIETERLILKPHEVTFNYAKMWYDLIQENKDFLFRFLDRLSKIQTKEDMFNRLTDVQKKWQNYEMMTYGIWTKDDNQLIGEIDTSQLNYDRQEVEIGYLLFKKYTGKGYITEAVKALEDNLFERGFNRLIIITDLENKTSQNVAIRCGYVQEAFMRKWFYNTVLQSWRNMYLYSKLKKEWKKENG